MSGGSYNYLYRDVEKVAENEDLRRMIDRLGELGHGDIAADLANLRRLAPVLHAVEWHDSCDWSMDQVAAAAEEYRDARPSAEGATPATAGEPRRIVVTVEIR